MGERRRVQSLVNVFYKSEVGLLLLIARWASLAGCSIRWLFWFVETWWLLSRLLREFTTIRKAQHHIKRLDCCPANTPLTNQGVFKVIALTRKTNNIWTQSHNLVASTSPALHHIHHVDPSLYHHSSISFCFYYCSYYSFHEKDKRQVE